MSVDKKTNKQVKRPKFVKSGAVITARLQTAKEVCVEDFTKYQALGRFTLRDSGWPRSPKKTCGMFLTPRTGKTIAIGKIMGLGPRKKKAAV